MLFLLGRVRNQEAVIIGFLAGPADGEQQGFPTSGRWARISTSRPSLSVSATW